MRPHFSGTAHYQVMREVSVWTYFEVTTIDN